jgi:hypothetical protein
MSYGIEIYSDTGQKVVDSATFGISLYDEIIVSPTDTGSKTYPDLSWFSNLWAIQTQIVTSGFTPTYTGMSGGAAEKRQLFTMNNLHAFSTTELSAIVLSGNVPKISWAPGVSVGDVAHDIRIRVLVT